MSSKATCVLEMREDKGEIGLIPNAWISLCTMRIGSRRRPCFSFGSDDFTLRLVSRCIAVEFGG